MFGALQFSRGQASAFMLLAFRVRTKIILKCSFHERTTLCTRHKQARPRRGGVEVVGRGIMRVFKSIQQQVVLSSFSSSADLKLEACRLQCWPRAEQAITVYDPSQYTKCATVNAVENVLRTIHHDSPGHDCA